MNGVPFLVMELVAGHTLRQELTLGPLNAERGALVAAGMARAQQAGIVHRDLKPENVMLTPDAGAKILDFGLARDVAGGAAGSPDTAAEDAKGGASDVTGVVGTRHYMSPEQAAGRPGDPRSDIFSFGIVLYEMLAGRRPFGSRGEHVPRAWSADDFRGRARLRSLARDVPPRLDQVGDKCLAYHASDRYADGGELSRALLAAETPPADRHRSLLFGAAAVAVLALVGAWLLRHSPPSAIVSPAPTPHELHRTTFDAAGQRWEVVDGEWFRDRPDLVGRSGHIQTTADLTDATVEMDVDFPKGPTATVGIGFRYSRPGDDPRAQCGYGFNVRPGPEVESFIGDIGDWNALGQGYRKTTALHDDHNHFVIRMVGSSFTVEANGQPIDAFHDAKWPRGRVDLWVARTETRFSKVRITKPSTPYDEGAEAP